MNCCGNEKKDTEEKGQGCCASFIRMMERCCGTKKEDTQDKEEKKEDGGK